MTNTADGGTGSFRQAILDANATAEPDRIEFNIAGGGVHTIAPLSALPEITQPVEIDAFTQPGFGGQPLIELNGTSAGITNGLTLSAGSSLIRGLAINRFQLEGIRVNGPAATGNRIQGNVIGVDPTATVARSNLFGGIRISGGATGTIVGTDGDGANDAAERNVISANGSLGIYVADPTTAGTVIAGNIIGLNGAGTARLGNGTWGIGINNAPGTLVGGDAAAERNILSGNSQGGVFIIGDAAVGTTVRGNYIGTDVTGTLDLGNLFSGVITGLSTGFTIEGQPATSGTATKTTVRDNVVSGNENYGVWLRGALATGNHVFGNRIGTNAAGTAAIGNTLEGVLIFEAPNNIVGTDGDGLNDLAERNLISGNVPSGIAVRGVGAKGNRIAGNFIGTNADGTAAIANKGGGIVVFAGATNTIVGTDGNGLSDDLEGNLVSGNAGDGVLVSGAQTANTRVAGNRVGTNAAGTAGLPNSIGVRVELQAPGTILGTDGNGVGDAAEGNQIAGNGVSPVGGLNGDVRLNGTINTIIAGNLIGLSAAGTASLAVFGAGIQVTGSTGVRIGTNGDGTGDALERNVIVGSIVRFSDTDNRGGPGVQIDGGSANTVVAGNFISVNRAGTAALPGNDNTGGIHVAGSVTGTVIGTNGDGVGDAVEGNLIDSGASYGILVSSGPTNTRIAGNRIGTDGTVALGAQLGVGVLVTGAATLFIGTDGDGTSDGLEGNVISGGGGGIVAGQTTGLRIAGNFIGTNAAGTAVVGNAASGIVLGLGQANAVVGTNGDGVSDDLERNVISGNATGVEINGEFQSSIFNTGNRVAGNRIGTNLAGNAALPNLNTGVIVHRGAGAALIGTNGDGVSDALEANLISGNAGPGIQLFQAAGGVRIAGNVIGTNLAGTAKLANTTLGVAISQTSNAIIGTNGDGVGDAAEGNLIAGNTSGGVTITDGEFGVASDGHRVAGNRIGLAGLGNGGFGVAVSAFGGFARNAVIGTNGDGTGDALEGNLILGNASGGVQVSGPTTNNAVIAGNRIASNGGTGITVSGAPSARVGTNGNGVSDDLERNVVSGNLGSGILIVANADGTVVAGNYIGTDIAGSTAIANAGAGIAISSSKNTRIGTNGDGKSDDLESNVISGNSLEGIAVASSTINTAIAGNFIGTDRSGTFAVANQRTGILAGPLAFGVRIGTDGDGSPGDAGERNVISGNRADGIVFTGSGGSDGMIVAGNFIGTNLAGTAAIPNVGIGVLTFGSNTRIGTNGDGKSDDLEGNVISGNGGAGVSISASNADVAGNRIGTNAAGTAAIANGAEGIFVGGSNARIGTNGDGVGDTLERNLISGNGSKGISVNGTTGTIVAGNYVGTDTTGTFAIGNLDSGVFVSGAAGAIIGTNGDGKGDDAEGNLISGNAIFSSDGLFLSGAATTGTIVAGNRIGTDASGTGAIPNRGSGVRVSGATNTRIGTDGDGVGDRAERNLISGNGAPNRAGSSIHIDGNSTATVVAGNFLGTNAAGTAQLSSGFNVGGVQIGISTNTNIGTNGDGTGDANEGNLIVGGLGNGIIITGDGSGSTRDIRIAGNLIGNNGSVAVGVNTGVGVLAIGGAKNVVVGTNGDGVSDALEGNVISGNVNGILAGGVTGLRISGNRIGTNAAGTAAIPNTAEGIRFGGIGVAQTNTLIGTDGDGVSDDLEGNLISGNGTMGIAFESGVNGNRIAGNRIGTSADGLTAIPNKNGGVQIAFSAFNNIVGTNGDGQGDAAEGNLISGNGGDAIGIYAGGGGSSGSADNNRVAGNIIGLNVSQSAALPNAGFGIRFGGFGFNHIVGTNQDGVSDDLEGNVISGNTAGGILFGANFGLQFVRTRIAGNLIAANGGDGIRFGDNVVSTRIENNTIRLHPGSGIRVPGDGIIGSIPATGNVFSQNILTGNGLLGIDLGNPGRNPNGAPNANLVNRGINSPTITSTTSSGSTTTVTGTFSGRANRPYRIEVFANGTNNPSTTQAEVYLGFVDVVTDSGGLAPFAATVQNSSLPAGSVSFTSTATDLDPADPDGTSELGPIRILNAPGSIFASTVTGFEGELIDLSNAIALADSDDAPGDVYELRFDPEDLGSFSVDASLMPGVTVIQNAGTPLALRGSLLNLQRALGTANAIAYGDQFLPTFAGGRRIALQFGNLAEPGQTVSTLLNVIVLPTASALSPTVPETFGRLGQSISVLVDPGPSPDNADGSETEIFTIEGVVGSFNRGTQTAPGIWHFTRAQLSDDELRFTPVDVGTYTFTLRLRVVDTVSLLPVVDEFRQDIRDTLELVRISVEPALDYTGSVLERSPTGTVATQLDLAAILAEFFEPPPVRPVGSPTFPSYRFVLGSPVVSGYDFTVDPDGTIRVGLESPDFSDVARRSFTVPVQLLKTVNGVTEVVQVIPVGIAILNVIEPPTVFGPAFVDGAEDAATPLTGLSFLVPDAGNGLVRVSLATTTGRLRVGTPAPGVTVAGQLTSGVTLTGTVAQINSMLAQPNGLVFEPRANFAGAGTFLAEITDFVNVTPPLAFQTFRINPVADAVPDPTAAGGSFLLGTAAALSIAPPALVDLDGSETLRILVVGVPAGGSLNRGMQIDSGTWSLAVSDLAGLAFAPPVGFLGSISLTVRSEVTDTVFFTSFVSGTDRFTSPGQTVVLNYVAPASLALAGGSVPENRPTGTAVGSVQIVMGLPGEQFAFERVSTTGYDFTLDPDGQIRIGSTVPDFEQIANGTITVRAVGDLGTVLTETFPIDIANVNEAPSIIAPAAIRFIEDEFGSIAGLVLADPDAGTATVELTLQVSHGSLAVAPSTAIIVVGQNSRELTLIGSLADLNALLADPNGLTYTPDRDYSGSDDFVIRVDDRGHSGSGGPLSALANRTIFVDAVADPPALAVEPATGNEGESIPLIIAAAAGDLDGSEVLTIRIGGVPSNVALSAGTLESNGEWLLTPDQLPGLFLVAPQDSGGATLSLAVTVVSVEPSNSSRAETVQTLAVTVVNEPPVLVGPPAVLVGEEGQPVVLPLGTLVDSGAESTWSITIAWGDGTREEFEFTSSGELGNRTHTFSEPGTYTIRLTVSDGTDTTAREIVVTVAERTVPVEPVPEPVPAGPTLMPSPPPVVVVPPASAPPILVPPTVPGLPNEAAVFTDSFAAPRSTPSAADPIVRAGTTPGEVGSAPGLQSISAPPPGEVAPGAAGPNFAGLIALGPEQSNRPLNSQERVYADSPILAGGAAGSSIQLGLSSYQSDRTPPTVLPLDPTSPTAGFGDSGGENLDLIDRLYRDHAAIPAGKSSAPPEPKRQDAPEEPNMEGGDEPEEPVGDQPDERSAKSSNGYGLAFLGGVCVALSALANSQAVRNERPARRPRYSLTVEDVT